jgi:hypothetical protein
MKRKNIWFRTKEQKLKDALIAAKCTQSFYKDLGDSPATQRPRNPYPLKTLVKQVLPVLPPNMVTFSAKARVTINGKVFTRTLKETVPFLNVVKGTGYTPKGMTAREVCQALQAKGFMVRLPTVAMTLSQSRWEKGFLGVRSSRLATEKQILLWQVLIRLPMSTKSSWRNLRGFCFLIFTASHRT